MLPHTGVLSLVVFEQAVIQLCEAQQVQNPNVLVREAVPAPPGFSAAASAHRHPRPPSRIALYSLCSVLCSQLPSHRQKIGSRSLSSAMPPRPYPPLKAFPIPIPILCCLQGMTSCGPPRAGTAISCCSKALEGLVVYKMSGCWPLPSQCPPHLMRQPEVLQLPCGLGFRLSVITKLPLLLCSPGLSESKHRIPCWFGFGFLGFFSLGTFSLFFSFLFNVL